MNNKRSARTPRDKFVLSGSQVNLALARYSTEEVGDEATDRMVHVMTDMRLSPMMQALWKEATASGPMTKYAFRHAAARIFLAGSLYGKDEARK